VPIPSYLFALASGDIKSAPIGPRSTVWTGPDELEGCKWELETDTETFIKAAEKIVSPYSWGTYNVLVLPSSFPYGGMEVSFYGYLHCPRLDCRVQLVTDINIESNLHFRYSHNHQRRQAECRRYCT